MPCFQIQEVENEEKRINQSGSVFQRKKRNPGKSVRDQTDTRDKDDQEFVEYHKEVQTSEKKKVIGLYRSFFSLSHLQIEGLYPKRHPCSKHSTHNHIF
jgi:hypothetical protein